MDIKESKLSEILEEIIQEDCEDVDGIIGSASSIILKLLKGDNKELVEKILSKASTDKTFKIT